jgi:hypothetical protein
MTMIIKSLLPPKLLLFLNIINIVIIITQVNASPNVTNAPLRIEHLISSILELQHVIENPTNTSNSKRLLDLSSSLDFVNLTIPTLPQELDTTSLSQCLFSAQDRMPLIINYNALRPTAQFDLVDNLLSKSHDGPVASGMFCLQEIHNIIMGGGNDTVRPYAIRCSFQSTGDKLYQLQNEFPCWVKIQNLQRLVFAQYWWALITHYGGSSSPPRPEKDLWNRTLYSNLQDQFNITSKTLGCDTLMIGNWTFVCANGDSGALLPDWKLRRHQAIKTRILGPPGYYTPSNDAGIVIGEIFSWLILLPTLTDGTRSWHLHSSWTSGVRVNMFGSQGWCRYYNAGGTPTSAYADWTQLFGDETASVILFDLPGEQGKFHWMNSRYQTFRFDDGAQMPWSGNNYTGPSARFLFTVEENNRLCIAVEKPGRYWLPHHCDRGSDETGASANAYFICCRGIEFTCKPVDEFRKWTQDVDYTSAELDVTFVTQRDKIICTSTQGSSMYTPCSGSSSPHHQYHLNIYYWMGMSILLLNVAWEFF